MASANSTIEIKPSKELLEAIEDAEQVIGSDKPFDYDILHPYAMLAARLVSEYYYALVEGKLPHEVINGLVYDFHRVLWSIPEDQSQE